MKTLLTILLLGVCSYSIAQSSYKEMTSSGPIKTSYTYIPPVIDYRSMTYEENMTSGVFFLALTGLAIYGSTVSDGPFTELTLLYGTAATIRLVRARKIKRRNVLLY